MECVLLIPRYICIPFPYSIYYWANLLRSVDDSRAAHRVLTNFSPSPVGMSVNEAKMYGV